MYIFKKQDVTKTQTLTQNKRRLLICVSVLFNILLFQVFFFLTGATFVLYPFIVLCPIFSTVPFSFFPIFSLACQLRDAAQSLHSGKRTAQRNH